MERERNKFITEHINFVELVFEGFNSVFSAVKSSVFDHSKDSLYRIMNNDSINRI